MSDEVKLWAFAVGNAPGPFAAPSTKRKAKAALDLIKEQEGFVGIDPQPPHGTMLLFRTENNAKRARNILRVAGVVCGKNIVEAFVDKKDLPKEG